MFEEGDVVYCEHHGTSGTVVAPYGDEMAYPVLVDFDNEGHRETYTSCGRRLQSNSHPSIRVTNKATSMEGARLRLRGDILVFYTEDKIHCVSLADIRLLTPSKLSTYTEVVIPLTEEMYNTIREHLLNGEEL